MAKRSLEASVTGIKAARLKLQARNLSQAAFGEELALAESTISKFFTGKSVDRRVFKEICEALELEWEDIAVMPDPVDVSPLLERDSDDREAVRQSARRARVALTPYILPPIYRQVLVDRTCTQINLGWREGKRRIVPILGPAGYGKSTLLGTVYDRLTTDMEREGSGWLALARCDDFIEGADTFEWEWGEKSSDRRESIVTLTKRLTRECGRGVLLLDTLDIVLAPRLVPVLRVLFGQLLEVGVTIAFTCRDRDYRDFFEPYHESFAGFREAVYGGCNVPPFEDGEVRQAASAFVGARSGYAEAGRESFADRVLALSANSAPLREIVRNPLLLALLCDLFAVSGTVPEDLTVSQLYDRYWNWKIAKTRQATQSRRVGQLKEKICLQVAAMVYQSSADRLRDFVYESRFDFDDSEFEAYSALKSDGVLKDIGNGRLAFFHQTFLEYAIARWMNSTPEGESAKQQLQSNISSDRALELHYYLWAVFRQLLALVPLWEFERLAGVLDCDRILAFRTLAFAAVARQETEAAAQLLSLLPIAETGGYTFQDALLVAANSAPTFHEEMVWSVAVWLLERSPKDLINRVTFLTAQLLARSAFAQRLGTRIDSGSRLEQALNAIEQRQDGSPANRHNRQHTVLGQLIGNYEQLRRQTWDASADPSILAVLRQHYFSLGSHLRELTLELHLGADVPESCQRQLLLDAMEEPPSDTFAEKQPAIQLLDRLLPSLLASGNTILGNSWLDVLQAPLDPRWQEITAAVIGQQAARDGDRCAVADRVAILLNLLFDLDDAPPVRSRSVSLGESSSPVDRKALTRCCLIALQEAIAAGGGNSVISALLATGTSENVPSNRISTLVSLIRTLSESELAEVEPSLAFELAQWLAPLAQSDPVNWIFAIDFLDKISLDVQQILNDNLENVLRSLKPKQVAPIVKKLFHVPDALEHYLLGLGTKEARTALLKIYYNRAVRGDRTGISKLAALSLDDSDNVAREAAHLLQDLDRQQLIPTTDILAMLSNTRVVSVRQDAIRIFLNRVNQRQATVSEIVSVFNAVRQETSPEVAQLVYELVGATIWNHPSGQRHLDEFVARAIFALTDGFVARPKSVPIMAQSAWVALNQMVRLENPNLVPEIADRARMLLRLADIGHIGDRRLVTGLLVKLAKHDPQLLERLVWEDCLSADRPMPVSNQVALAVAIANERGVRDPLLDELLGSDRAPEAVKSRILRERGA